MAVTTQTSTQIANAEASPVVRTNAVDVSGKLRVAYFSFEQDGAGDDGSSVALVDLPRGRVRVYPGLSYMAVSALGASRVMDLGFDAYTGIDGVSVSADADYFATDIDVSAAAVPDFAEAVGNAEGKLFVSRDGVRLRATVTGGTIPDAATMSGFVVFAIDA